MFLVRKKYLLLIAGLFWTFAGFMIVKIGYTLIPVLSQKIILIISGFVIFYLFYHFIFSKLVYKHEKRIRNNPNEKMPVWLFFDGKSYIIMIAMMTFGITIRYLHLVPNWFIAFFYSGLGTALLACGIRFIIRFLRYEKGLRVIPRFEKNQ